MPQQAQPQQQPQQPRSGAPSGQNATAPQGSTGPAGSYAAGAAAVAPSPQAREAGRRIRVERGDSLWTISGRELGDPRLWPKLWAANRAVVPNKNALAVGTSLVIPRELDGRAAPGGSGETSGDAEAATTPAPPVAAPAEAAAPVVAPIALRGDALAAAIRYYERNGSLYRNHVVRRIQEAVGCKQDGVLGGDTIRHVAGWQRSRGLGVDGIAGPGTLGAMFGRDIRRDPPPRVAPPADGAILSEQGVWSAADWLRRHRSQYTPSVLRQLEGHLGKPVDGTVDAELVRAVGAWQKAHGLEVDGIPGPLTLRAMFGRDIRTGQPGASPGVPAQDAAGGTDRPNGLAQIRRVFGEPGTGIVSRAMRAGPGGAIVNVPCHGKIADKLAAVFEDVHRDGLSEHIRTYDGCYVYRRKRGTTGSWSTHAWGIAIDVNAAWNPMVKKRANMKVSDGQNLLIPYFERHGFYWGGHFGDPMHFQYCTGY
ncbi:MAG: peptidoglycan-binding protein [Deltaproteobacteria bacterium]|nr:peptidoglycan-binding protein [Deltaproteobacteria bacterium]